MSATFISHDGEPPIVELEPFPAYDPLTGDALQRRWEGSPERIKAKYAELRAQGVRCRIAEALNGIGLSLTSDFAGVFNSSTGSIDPTLSVVVTDWTSEPAVFSKSLWDFPPLAAEFDKLGTTEAGLDDARLLRNYIDAYVRGDPTLPDPADPTGRKTYPVSLTQLLTTISEAGLSVPVFSAFVMDLLRGRTSFSPASWTLRRSRRIPAVSTFRESDVNVGRMLTLGAMTGEGFSTDLLRTSIPTIGYWLKHPPTDRPVGDGFREVNTDYEWAENYSRFIYGNPVTG